MHLIFSSTCSPLFRLWYNVLKLMLGKFRYSDLRLYSLRRGNVQRNALANRHPTCCWLSEIDLLLPCLSSGMADGISSGNRRAKRITSGRVSVKNAAASASSSSCEIQQKWVQAGQAEYVAGLTSSNNSCKAWNFHCFAYLVLYDRIARSKSRLVRIGCNKAFCMISHRDFRIVTCSSV